MIIFGVQHKNPNWMPYPMLNWASWSYGVAILATFLSLFVTLAFEFTWREAQRTLESAGYDFPMSRILRKREKAAIIEKQEKAVRQARLEQIRPTIDEPPPPVEDHPSRARRRQSPSLISGQSADTFRGRSDPRFGGKARLTQGSLLSADL